MTQEERVPYRGGRYTESSYTQECPYYAHDPLKMYMLDKLGREIARIHVLIKEASNETIG